MLCSRLFLPMILLFWEKLGAKEKVPRDEFDDLRMLDTLTRLLLDMRCYEDTGVTYRCRPGVAPMGTSKVMGFLSFLSFFFLEEVFFWPLVRVCFWSVAWVKCTVCEYDWVKVDSVAGSGRTGGRYCAIAGEVLLGVNTGRRSW